MLFVTIQRRLFFSHILAVLLVSGSIGTYFYFSSAESLMSSLRERLKNSVALVSTAVDVSDLDHVQSPEDMERPAYLHSLQVLREFRKTNPDIAYLYVMRLTGERVEFVIDSDPTEKQAKPGQEYTSVVPALMEGFARPSADEEVYEDEWGTFLSGYAPVPDGKGAYLVGIDMRADEVARKFRHLRFSGLLSLAASVILAFAFSRILSGHFTAPVSLLIAQCRAIAQGRLDERIEPNSKDELDDLIRAFNSMSDRLLESRTQQRLAEDELRSAKQHLEIRVAERTRELEEANRQLQHEVEERTKAQEALAEAARTDPLTGLLNRRAMTEHMGYHVARVIRHGRPFCLLLGDLDHFKSVNDRHGHAEGDRVLLQVAELLRSSVRREDLVGRWGGEEFLLLLPDTDIRQGRILAEKIRAAILAYEFICGGEPCHVTMSIGLAEYDGAAGVDKCLVGADKALYIAKGQGRNSVVVESP
ncbi:MAG: diguanylate cyclase [Syntrophotaleaceae bacterium]